MRLGFHRPLSRLLVVDRGSGSHLATGLDAGGGGEGVPLGLQEGAGPNARPDVRGGGHTHNERRGGRARPEQRRKYLGGGIRRARDGGG